MKILITNTARTLRNDDIITVPSMEMAIEQLYLRDFDAVILGKDTPEMEEKRLRAILSHRPGAVILYRQREEELEDTLSQVKETLRYLRLKKVQFNDTFDAAGMADRIQVVS